MLLQEKFLKILVEKSTIQNISRFFTNKNEPKKLKDLLKTTEMGAQ